MKNIFSITNQAFENIRHSSLEKHEIQFSPATQLIQTTSQLFRILDHSDSVQAEFSLRLWVLRSSILFTIFPFDNPVLGLQDKVNELEKLSERLPDTIQFMEPLKKCITNRIQ